MMFSGYSNQEIIYESDTTRVYRCLRETDQEKVILKTVNLDYPSPETLARFDLEYSIANRAQVEGVVEVIGFKQFDNKPYIVMKDIGGSSLVHLLPQLGNKLPIREFLPLALRITYILDLLHRKKIIHKDITPANIVWNQDTGEVNIIDFGISTELSREIQEILNPETLEGTLPYMSPEQTGRMNRAMDYRTDLYSLGVLFYQLLTGTLPFTSQDAMELVHCHIARLPIAPREIDPSIPKILSDITMKLISKMADDRYQSAIGIRADLQRCLDDLVAGKPIEDFPVGRDDSSIHFHIPQKLYGRERELSTLLDGFSRASKGSMEMMLVAGYSGIGKSSLVQEVYRPIVEKRGYFISGKFDQYQHEVPYFSILQAFKGLVEYLLTESNDKLSTYKESLLSALDGEGQLLVDVIPELELIIGQQQPVVKMTGLEAQKRFSRVFIRFLHVASTADHPLVLFLDDLHRADPASLQLIESIMLQKQGHHLFLIGAYRENEVSPTHPLILTLDKIKMDKMPSTHLTSLSLKPLNDEDSYHFLADALGQEGQDVRALAKMVQNKTGGNPFFLSQLLTSLYENNLINPDHSSGGWNWDLDQIRARKISDNVADLLAERIQKLPATSQNLLSIASCLGTHFDLHTLAHVAGLSSLAVATALQKAVKEEMIVPHGQLHSYYQITGDGFEQRQAGLAHYHFLHDRVQEAAYAKIDDRQRADIHLKAGRLLLSKVSDKSSNDWVFAVVNHFGHSGKLVTDREEIEKIAKLNLLAGRRAKISAAYSAALEYFTEGIQLITEAAWENHYPLIFQLYSERIECEFLCGNTTKARDLFDYAVNKVENNCDCGKLYELMIRICHINSSYDEGIELGRRGLQLFDIEIPDSPEEYERVTAQVLAEIATHTESEQKIFQLVEAPAMEDEAAIVCCGILHELWVCLFMSANPKVLLPALKLIRLSLLHGQSSITAVGYIFYALILSMQQDYDKAYTFGRLAMLLKDKYFSPLLAPKVHNTFCNFVNHYKNHIQENIPIYEDSFRYCVQSGEIWWGAWAASFIHAARFIKGDPLEQVQGTGNKYKDYIKEADFAPLVLVMEGQSAIVDNLMDKAGNRTSLDTQVFNEEYTLSAMAAMPFGLGLFWHYIYKAFTLYLNGEYALALEASMLADHNKTHIPGLMMYPDHFFYNCLIIAANWENFNDGERAKYKSLYRENLQQMDVWQGHCPENYTHRQLLMAAELARLEDRHIEAMELYDRAIEAAGNHKYTHHQAVASELAGQFYLCRNHYHAAKGYLMEARYLYLRWGAKRKLRYFDQTYPELVPYLEEFKINESIVTTNRSQALDYTSILKASQAISKEIVLDSLLKKLMAILLENAGAQKGFLILQEDGQIVIKAKGNIAGHHDIAIESVAVDNLDPTELLPLSIINYVTRTAESVVLSDAATDETFARDEFIMENSPKSILCIPLINQGNQGGLLYLENNLASGVFTPDRLELLTLLSSQAAIAIENASLYTSLEQKVELRTSELMQINQMLQAEVAERKRVEEALVKANRELHLLASLDGLTKVANRRYFDEFLATEFRRMKRHQHPLSLVMCDVDYFKNYNDHYGHQKGDDCLKAIAQQLQNSTRRAADLVARYGGEEFMVVLPGSDLSGAQEVARVIQENLKKHQIPHCRSLVSDYVTTSIGISSTMPSENTDIKTLIHKADQALYQAKNSGRNCIASIP